MKISFLNNAHQKRFDELRFGMVEETVRTDPKCLTLIYLMAGDSRFFTKISPYFNTTKGAFDSEAMFENEEFGSSLKILAKVAANLFDHTEQVTPLDLVSTLEDEHLQLTLNAILLRRYGISLRYDVTDEKIYS